MPPVSTTHARDITSIRKQARFAGLLYLLLVPTGVFALIYVPSTLFVFGDAASTVGNIEASEPLYRWGIYVGLLSNVLYLLVGLALYRLFRDVSKTQATLLVVFVALGVAAAFANTFNQLAVLIILDRPAFLSAFDPGQLEGLAYLFLRLQTHGIQVVQIFWGLWLIPMGTLVYRCGFIPRILGVSLWLAAAGYLLSNLLFVLLPQYTAALSSVTTGLEMLELPIILWLVIVGVRMPRSEAA